MLHASQARASFVFLVALTVPACGSSESPSSPTPRYYQSTSTMSGPPIAAHSSTCWEFDNAKAGPVSADVSPRTIRVILAAGKCSAPGQVLAERDAEVVNVDAPTGWIHVTLSNVSDVDLGYTLRVTYWH